MEIKKSKRAELETKRRTFFLIGLIAALSLVWMSFEYKSYTKASPLDFKGYMGEEEDLMMIQTKMPEKIQPPKIISPKIVVVIDETPDIPDIDINIEIDLDGYIDDPIIDDGNDDDDLTDEKIVFVPVEDQPQFPGGEAALMKFLSQIKYPEIARESLTEGIVYITFVVEKDGSISGVEVVKGIGNGCDEESLRIVKKMPKWIPGKQRGKAVRVRMNVPIKFVLSN